MESFAFLWLQNYEEKSKVESSRKICVFAGNNLHSVHEHGKPRHGVQEVVGAWDRKALHALQKLRDSRT